MTETTKPTTIFQKAKNHFHRVMNGNGSKEAHSQRSKIGLITGILCPVVYYLFTIATEGKVPLDLTPFQFSMNLLIPTAVLGLETNRQITNLYKSIK